LQVLLEGGGSTAPERRPQTGDGRAVSYAGLVLDRHRAGRGEELLDQIVLLAVQRGPTEEVHAERALERLTVVRFLLPGLVAGLDDPLGDHVGGLFEADVLPVGRPGAAVLDPGLAHRRVDQLLGGGSLRAQPAARDRRVLVALDLDDLLVLDVDLLAAADR